jgi:hypothetical protein
MISLLQQPQTGSAMNPRDIGVGINDWECLKRETSSILGSVVDEPGQCVRVADITLEQAKEFLRLGYDVRPRASAPVSER